MTQLTPEETALISRAEADPAALPPYERGHLRALAQRSWIKPEQRAAIERILSTVKKKEGAT